jgi:GNAT superfamily N-acetyltransferase
MITYRSMRPEDIPAGLSLCRFAGWNQIERDWQLFLKINPDGCLVAVDEIGRVVGTVTTVPYQHYFTWIGMVLVHPEMQRKGIGTQLLREALRFSDDTETAKLDATPAGREVYLKLDFKDEYQISRMYIGEHSKKSLPESYARPIQTKDLSGILKMDREVFGADRRLLLKSNMEGAPQYAFVVEKQGEIMGYCFGRPGYNFNHLGPVIADDPEIAMHLLSAALQKGDGKPTVLDILDHTPEWTRFVSSLGFVVLRPLMRMYRGSNSSPGMPEKQFSILGPEFG